MGLGAAGAAIGGVLSSGLGIGAATADIIGTGLVGAGLGATESAITGGNPLTGALTGGLTGGLGGVGANLAPDLGITAAEGGALGGALGGLAGAEATGGNPLTAAAIGGAGGYVRGSGGLGNVFGGSGTPTTGATGTTAAAGAINPAAIGTDVPISTDLTAGGGAGGSVGAPAGNSGLDLGGGLNTSSGGPSGSLGAVNTNFGIDSTKFGSTGLGDFGGASGTGSGGGVGGASGPTTSVGKLLAPGGFTGSNLLNVAESNPAAIVGALGLGYSALKGQQVPQQSNLTGIAGNLNTTGQQMMQYLQSGTLPPGAQQAVDAAKQANIAQIRQQYASQGLAGSTMETQAIEAANTAAETQAVQIATQLAQQGVSESQISAELYAQIAQMQTASNADMTKAIAEFAASLGGAGTRAA